MKPTKIVIVGPKRCGKSTIANFIAGNQDSLQLKLEGSYEPTYGVRILETKNTEYWDCSGDHTFEGCWQSIMKSADGVLIVFNPDEAGHEQQLSEWVRNIK